MPPALIGRKLGTTRLYDEAGKNVPVTVIEAGPNAVSQVKTEATDGYDAVQLAFDDVKARNSTMPVIGHDAKSGLSPKRTHREVRLTRQEVAELEAGQVLTVEAFEGVKFVDVAGTSKGKGYAGVMRRWGFKGQPASHGTERKHRAPGSIGGRASNAGTGRPKRGAKMAGQYGNCQITVRSLKLLSMDKDKNLLLVKGVVPGPNQGLVMIRQSKRLSKSKSLSLAAS